VFGHLGYEGTRVDDIVAAASLSHGTFYRYFSGKEDLFRDLVEPAVEELLVLLAELPEPRGGPRSWAQRLHESCDRQGGVLAAWAGSAFSRAVLPPAWEVEIRERVEAALAHRRFGDLAVDTTLLVTHVERAPHLARIYGLSRSEAVDVTVGVLEWGCMGRSLTDSAGEERM
jgi:AcrR family transcriptional regulator